MAEEKEAAVIAALTDGTGRIDWTKYHKAKFVSDLAHRLDKGPGQLTAE
jgi:hypothetical protein